MKRRKSTLPYVSVIMPIRNEEAHIEQSLGAVLKQKYPSHKMEVIIADGMSDDRTLELIRKITRRSKIRVKILENKQRITPSGLNMALVNSIGEVIIRVDGHTIIEPDYIVQCVQALEKSGAANVGGRMDAFAINFFGQAVALVTSSPFGVGNSRFHYSQIEEEVDTVYLGAWRREIFECNGLFNEELVHNQDDEFNYRLRENGYKILLSPKIRSLYFNRSSLRSLWRQYYRYGFWKIRVLQLRPGQMSWRQFIPAIFVCALIFSGVLAIFSVTGTYLLLFVLTTYFLASLLFSLLISARERLSFFLVLPICFLTLHFSYGFGFLRGLLYFRRSWGKKPEPKSLVIR